ncbi:uncharacterized protein V1513DRAFT_430905 [Lipomyces chichibuensis]|uniref:uncharacterized protein n=1 Tax=Lipomyces chichibuensis TaxID=1546026 RepID=UPI003343264C
MHYFILAVLATLACVRASNSFVELLSSNGTHTNFTIIVSAVGLFTGLNVSSPLTDLSVQWVNVEYQHYVYANTAILDPKDDTDNFIANYTDLIYLGNLSGIEEDDYVATFTEVASEINMLTGTNVTYSNYTISSALLRKRASDSAAVRML